MQQLPDDTMHEIMLNAPAEFIQSICISNKYYNNYCNDAFWIQKFNHDNLPIIKEPIMTLKKWVTLYNKSIKVQNNVNDILNTTPTQILIYVDSYNQKGYKHLYQIPFLPQEIFNNINHNTEPNLIMSFFQGDNQYKLSFVGFYQGNILRSSVIINQDTLSDILFHFLFQNKVTITY